MIAPSLWISGDCEGMQPPLTAMSAVDMISAFPDTLSSELVPLGSSSGPSPSPSPVIGQHSPRTWLPITRAPSPPWTRYPELLLDMVTPSKTAHAKVPPQPAKSQGSANPAGPRGSALAGPAMHDSEDTAACDRLSAGPAVDGSELEGECTQRKPVRVRRGKGKKRQAQALKLAVRTSGTVFKYKGGVQKGDPTKNVVIGRRQALVRQRPRTLLVDQPSMESSMWTVYDLESNFLDAQDSRNGAKEPRAQNENPNMASSGIGLGRLVTLEELIYDIATPKAPRKSGRLASLVSV